MSKTISQDTMKYMLDGIKYVCDTFKKRAPGTKSERDSQEFFKKELEKYSDEVTMEDFTLHPHSFMGFIPIAAFFFLMSVILYWCGSTVGSAVMAVVLPLLAVLMFVVEFMMYRELVDFLFPKAVSRNVFAARKPSGEVKRRIIFGGHADAAYEWTYSLHGQMKALAPVIFGAITGMFFSAGISIAMLVSTLVNGSVPAIEGAWKVLGIIDLCFVPFGIAIMFFINWRVIVDGANDNLSAAYVAMSVLKDMSDADFRFENTEVCCLISGSEEAGLRGAVAYAKKHREELLETETVFIAMDTMTEIDQMMVYTRGCTGTVHDDEAVGDLIYEAGKNVGIDMPRAGLYPGAIDSEGFTRFGIRAAGFCGVNHNPKTYYHTRHDTFENINPECIELSLKVCKEAAELYDRNGGIAKYEKARS